DKKSIQSQGIFTCSSTSVMIEVARMAFNLGIKFGIVTEDKEGKIRIINQNSTTDETRVLIIGCPSIVAKLLKKTGSENYWLFFDEITMGADNKECLLLKDSMEVLKLLPKSAILASATLCKPEDMKEIVSYHSDKHPEVFIGTVDGYEVFIGCDLRTFEMVRIIPHAGC